jgi:hypothetical protein
VSSHTTFAHLPFLDDAQVKYFVLCIRVLSDYKNPIRLTYIFRQIIIHFMAIKLSELLIKQGHWVEDYWESREKQEASGHEHFDIVSGLGRLALMGIGTWIGKNDGKGITFSGEPVEIDPKHPLTRLVLTCSVKMGALNDMSFAMNGECSGFLPERYVFLRQNLDGTGYEIGMKILKYLHQESGR